MTNKKISDEMRNSVFGAYLEIRNLSKVARTYGVHRDTVRRIVYEKSGSEPDILRFEARKELIKEALSEHFRRLSDLVDHLTTAIAVLPEQIDLKGTTLKPGKQYRLTLRRNVYVLESAATVAPLLGQFSLEIVFTDEKRIEVHLTPLRTDSRLYEYLREHTGKKRKLWRNIDQWVHQMGMELTRRYEAETRETTDDSAAHAGEPHPVDAHELEKLRDKLLQQLSEIREHRFLYTYCRFCRPK